MSNARVTKPVPADWKPIDPASIFTLGCDIPAIVQTGPTWATTKPWTARQGWTVAIRERTAEHVDFDLINGSLYRATVEDFDRAIG